MSVAGVQPLLRNVKAASTSAGSSVLPFSQRNWVAPVMMLGDVAVLEGCVFVSYLVREAIKPLLPITLAPLNYTGIGLGVLVLPFVFLILGLYPGYGANGPERLRRRVVSTAALFFALCGWDYLVQGGLWSRGILLITGVFATVALPLCASAMIWLLTKAGAWGAPVLVLGPVDAVREMITNLGNHRSFGFVPVGYLADGHEQEHEQERSLQGVPCLGAITEANRFADCVKTVVIVRPQQIAGETLDFVMRLAFPHVVLVPGLFGNTGMWLAARDLGNTTGLEVKKNLLIPHNRLLKRCLDYAITVPLFLFSLPLFAILCLMIVAISPGNPFFVQIREGKGGRCFRMLKLRTMYPDAEARLEQHLETDEGARREWALHCKLRQDPRILPFIGGFLRKSSLDELPQLWNVLVGDMSLVGPRPFPHYHLDKFGPTFRELRRSVIPGLTGLWQVEARSNGDLKVQEALDSYYIRNWSIWLDLDVIFRTFAAVAQARGAR